MGRAAAVPARPSPARPSPAHPPANAPRRGRTEFPSQLPTLPIPRGAAVLDALLHGRAWIAIVFALLAGIVLFNVDLLRMNREIAVAAERTALVKRENARLRTDLARLGSSERIQRVASERGLVLPAPGEVRYLRSDPKSDARRAAGRIAADEADVAPLAKAGAPAGQAGAPAETGAAAGQAGAPAGQTGTPAVQPGVIAAQPPE